MKYIIKVYKDGKKSKEFNSNVEHRIKEADFYINELIKDQTVVYDQDNYIICLDKEKHKGMIIYKEVLTLTELKDSEGEIMLVGETYRSNTDNFFYALETLGQKLLLCQKPTTGTARVTMRIPQFTQEFVDKLKLTRVK